ncbi:MAG: cupin-like domain-containing protein [Pseudomonadota bacterium]
MDRVTKKIPELHGVTADVFRDEILPAAQPIVLKGLVQDWPAVRAGRESFAAFSDYLKRFDRGALLQTRLGPPEIKGLFFYNDDLSAFNFEQRPTPLNEILDRMEGAFGAEQPPAVAAQSVPTRANFPGFEEDNPMPLLTGIEPRLWIGGPAIVAPHNDAYENIACVTAGRRRFTLFPPEQVRNLYVGPFEMTPAGVNISLASMEEPDFERHPKFAEALAAAMTAELEPGDAIYIPYLWWHHVQAFEPYNMLANYWWVPLAEGRGEPGGALLHALLSIKNLPRPHRQAWSALFEHYVFNAEEGPCTHLPKERQGIFGDLDAERLRGIRQVLAKRLAQP